MHYLIDGYNLFFWIQHEVLPLEKKRTAFIDAVDSIFAQFKQPCTLIFDSGQRIGECFPSKKLLDHIEVIFSPQHLSADDYMIEWLTAQPSPTQYIVVTSDRELSKRAAELGAKTQTLSFFCRHLQKKKSKIIRREEEKLAYDTEAEFNRLLSIFEKRFKNDQSS